MINGSHSEHGPGKNGFIKKKSENYRGCKPRDAPLLRFMKSNYKKYRAKAASQAQYEKTFIINESLFLSAIFRLEIKILPAADRTCKNRIAANGSLFRFPKFGRLNQLLKMAGR